MIMCRVLFRHCEFCAFNVLRIVEFLKIYCDGFRNDCVIFLFISFFCFVRSVYCIYFDLSAFCCKKINYYVLR